MQHVTLLRTLARKSTMGFGKFSELSVQQLLDMKEIRLLRWYYYNCSKISFLPDILDEIGISEEWRIEKPGKDPEMNDRLNELKDKNHNCFLHRLTEEDKKEACKQSAVERAGYNKKKKTRYRSFINRDAVTFSKGSMAWKNQGH